MSGGDQMSFGKIETNGEYKPNASLFRHLLLLLGLPTRHRAAVGVCSGECSGRGLPWVQLAGTAALDPPQLGCKHFDGMLDGTIATVRNARWRKVICDSLETSSLETKQPA